MNKITLAKLNREVNHYNKLLRVFCDDELEITSSYDIVVRRGGNMNSSFYIHDISTYYKAIRKEILKSNIRRVRHYNKVLVPIEYVAHKLLSDVVNGYKDSPWVISYGFDFHIQVRDNVSDMSRQFVNNQLKKFGCVEPMNITEAANRIKEKSSKDWLVDFE